MPIEIKINNGFYESFSSPLAAQSCINLYPTTPQVQGAQSIGALFPTQGIDKHLEVSGICRGMYVFGGVLFSINEQKLYQVNRNGTFIDKGGISGSGKVSFADNGVTMSIVVPSGDAYFYYNGSLDLITDAVFADFQSTDGGVTSVSSKDGYLIYTTKKEFFWSSIAEVNFGRNFDALDFSTAEQKPDDIVRSMIVRNELYIFGTQTIEIFQNTGTAAATWIRVNGATIDKGLVAQFSSIEFDNSFVFLGAAYGESPSIWRGAGGATRKISTDAIDNVISNYTDEELSNSYVFKYAENGNFFVCFTISDKTFCFDATNSTWHQRESNGIQYRVNDSADIYGDIYVGDDRSGLIGIFNKNTYTEYTETVTRSFATSYLTNQGIPLSVSSLELNTESGVGTFKENSLGVNPVVNMSFSDDGGNTFSVPQSKAIGVQGDFIKRQIWNRQGRISVSRVFKFVVIEPVKVVFLNLWLNIKVGSNGK